jgi:hypothetical protein
MNTVKIALVGTLVLLLTACGGSVATTFLPTSTPQEEIRPTSTSYVLPPPGLAPTPECTDSLYFLNDLTIPDNTIVAPGGSIDKQWLVQNNGTCNWDSRYRLRLINDNPLGAPSEQALYPARSGTQATLRILFTAPADAGSYVSEWQAYDPNGIPFGDSFFIKIVVQP